MSIKASIVLAIGILLAGCARFEPRPLAPAQNAERLQARSLTNESLRVFIETNSHRQFVTWPTNAWDFEALTFAAFYYHPSLDVARAQWAVAMGGERTAAKRPNPVLTVTPGYDTTTSIPSPWIPLTFLDVPLETAGKRKYRRAQALRLAEAARLNVANVAWQVRSDLRSGMMELISSEQHQELLQRQVELESKIVDLLQKQLQAGAVAGSELVPFRLALIKARLDLIDAQRLTAEARSRVAEAIGVPLQALEGVHLTFTGLESLESITQLSSAEMRQTALVSRPDILGALADYAASESALQLEVAKQYPDIHLQPGYQYDQGDNKWSLGLVVELPVLSHNQGPIVEAQARREEAAAKFNALQSKVLSEIERAVQGVQVSEKNLFAVRALLDEQAKRVNSVSQQVKVGAVDQLELLNAQTESLTAELAQTEGRLKLQQAIAALEDAVRHPFDLPAVIFAPREHQTNER